MKKVWIYISVVFLLMVTGTILVAQFNAAGPVASFVVSTSNVIPKYVAPQQGTPVLNASLISDNGTVLSYTGTGGVSAPGIVGATGGTGATAGFVGQVISSLVPSGSAVSLTTATAAQVASVSLTAGDWAVESSVNFVGTSTTIAAGSLYEISINSGTGCSSPAQVTDGTEVFLTPAAVTTTSTKFGNSVPSKIFNVSSTTTVCVIATGTFTAGTEAAYGSLTAQRIY